MTLPAPGLTFVTVQPACTNVCVRKGIHVGIHLQIHKSNDERDLFNLRVLYVHMCIYVRYHINASGMHACMHTCNTNMQASHACSMHACFKDRLVVERVLMIRREGYRFGDSHTYTNIRKIAYIHQRENTPGISSSNTAIVCEVRSPACTVSSSKLGRARGGGVEKGLPTSGEAASLSGHSSRRGGVRIFCVCWCVCVGVGGAGGGWVRVAADVWVRVCLISRILFTASCSTCCMERPSAPIALVPKRERERENKNSARGARGWV